MVLRSNIATGQANADSQVNAKQQSVWSKSRDTAHDYQTDLRNNNQTDSIRLIGTDQSDLASSTVWYITNSPYLDR